jgi:hypothetical protein
MMHIVNKMMKFIKLNLFSTTKYHIQIFKKWMIQYIQNQNHYIQLTFGLTI